MDPLLTALLSGGGMTLVTALVMAWVNRRNQTADTREKTARADALEEKTFQDNLTFWQGQVTRTVAEMRDLEAQVRTLKATIEEVRTQYEQRVGNLHGQLEDLSKELKRANDQLDTANKTITELRGEVKLGNQTITKLNETITKLLVEQAKIEEGNDG